MKKIIHVAYEHRSGDVRILKKECTTLKENCNYKLVYITSSKNSNPGTHEENGVEVCVHPLRNIRGIRLFAYIHDIKALVRNDCGVDLVHIHEYVLLPLIKPLKRMGKAVIYDKHENTVDEIEETVGTRFGKRIGRLVGNLAERYENRCIELSDAYITVTPSYTGRDETINKTSVMIPNFPFPKTNGKNRTLEEFERCNGVMCFAGGISDLWSISRIIDVMNDINNVELIMAGPCDDDYLDMLMSKPAWGRVHFCGYVSFEKVDSIYNDSYIGLALLHSPLQSANELGTLGNTKLFECMQAGLPVICTNSEIWRDIVNEHNCGICIDATDNKSVFEAIEYLMNNPLEAYEMGQNGRKAIAERYNWGESKKLLLGIYKDILGE